MPASEPRRRAAFLAPEVVQTSGMDCGPASLKCLLSAAGLEVSYPRLREACQTDVDGTSIDVLEEVAKALGAPAEQVMVPLEHLFEPESRAFPALAVVRQPGGNVHFLVLWRRVGPLIQLMDPGAGRRWCTRRELEEELYVHQKDVPADAFEEWARSDEFRAPLERRIERLTDAGCARELMGKALAEPGWQPLAGLAAATHFVGEVARGRVLGRPELAALLRGLAAHPGEIPAHHWPARPSHEDVAFRGVILLRLGAEPASEPEAPTVPVDVASLKEDARLRLAGILAALLKRSGRGAALWLVLAAVIGAGAVTFEALLFRALLELRFWLTMTGEYLGAIGALLAFGGGLLLIEAALALGARAVGRKLDMYFRTELLQKLARLPDKYFRTRLPSDMADRSHAVDRLRLLPVLASDGVRLAVQLLATAIALMVLVPKSSGLVLLAVVGAVGIPLLALAPMSERDQNLRAHATALVGFYLDALLGLWTLRAHGAAHSFEREHESVQAGWVRSARGLQGLQRLTEAVQLTWGLGTAVLLVATHLDSSGVEGRVLLTAWWALSVPVLGDQLAALVRQLPWIRSHALRLAELLDASEEQCAASAEAPELSGPVAVKLEGVSVRPAGHRVLEAVDLDIPAGEHVAIVGRSGAGKSSLLGLLLGFHPPDEGAVKVDGKPLDAALLQRLRNHTAWIDPQVQLWNGPLLDNLLYGSSGSAHRVGAVVHPAELGELLSQLQDGMATPLGEGGRLLSGGEGQRVRLGRALTRDATRLVLLDEPFRGVDRAVRSRLLDRARAHWAGVTLLCVTHDIRETLSFPRVIVFDGGRVVEDGPPQRLASEPGSVYASLLAAEDALRASLSESGGWRRVLLGSVSEKGARP